MNKERLKTVLYLFGSILAIVGIAFVVVRLNAYWEALSFEQISMSNWGVLLGFSLVYGCSVGILQVGAWRNIMLYLSARMPWTQSLRLYGISHLCRYVPGNVVHLAGRQALGMGEGLPGKALALSTIWELGLLTFSGGFFIILTLPESIHFPSPTIAASIFVLLVVFTTILSKKLISPLISLAFFKYIIFLTINGAIFYGIIKIMVPVETAQISFFTICGIYIAAWLAGLVTPGAPAGVGIRELVLLIFLKPYIPENDLLLAVLLGRLMTIVGDIFLFIVAVYFVRRKRQTSCNLEVEPAPKVALSETNK